MLHFTFSILLYSDVHKLSITRNHGWIYGHYENLGLKVPDMNILKN